MITPLTGNSNIDRAIGELTTALLEGMKTGNPKNIPEGAAIEKAIAELVKAILEHKNSSSAS